MSELAAADALEWTVGDRLRKAREVRRIGVEEMGEKLLRTRQTITNYEKGHTRPTNIVLARWAELTGVSIEWILTGKRPAQQGDKEFIGNFYAPAAA